MSGFKWLCPFCDHYATITEEDQDWDVAYLTIENKDGPRALQSSFNVCPNPEGLLKKSF
jgi:hypothetical protein